MHGFERASQDNQQNVATQENKNKAFEVFFQFVTHISLHWAHLFSPLHTVMFQIRGEAAKRQQWKEATHVRWFKCSAFMMMMTGWHGSGSAVISLWWSNVTHCVSHTREWGANIEVTAALLCTWEELTDSCLPALAHAQQQRQTIFTGVARQRLELSLSSPTPPTPLHSQKAQFYSELSGAFINHHHSLSS